MPSLLKLVVGVVLVIPNPLFGLPLTVLSVIVATVLIIEGILATSEE